MTETVVAMKLPVDESLRIQKNRIMPAILRGRKEDRGSNRYPRRRAGGPVVCYELLRRLKAEPERLRGIVDVYPALNPLGIDSITRGIPCLIWI